MNLDASGDYDPRIAVDQQFASITGILEQYANTGWDYYQLVTTKSADLVVTPEPCSILMLLFGAAGMIFGRRRVRRA